jgi:hypothetical protein
MFEVISSYITLSILNYKIFWFYKYKTFDIYLDIYYT